MPIDAKSIYPAPSPSYNQFPSRRSVVHSTNGMVACTQPLAARCGLRVLEQGGNAADAAVAVAAGLNMTEPGSTGIGGDMFCLYYDVETKKVSALNGSGRTGAQSTRDAVRKDLGLAENEYGTLPLDHVHAVTVPGAAAGWIDTVERFGSGRLSLEQILMPAIELGEQGFPVHEISAYYWGAGEKLLRKSSPNFAEMLKPCSGEGDGYRAPKVGEIITNPTLSQTFRTLAKHGKSGFYTGRIAEAIVEVCQARGGLLTLEDLKKHLDLGSQSVDPISLRLKSHNALTNDHTDNPSNGQDESAEGQNDDEDVEVWEHPPNGQGIVALIALGILERLEEDGKIPKFTPENHNSAGSLHAIIEALRIAFADARWWVCDTDHAEVPVQHLTSKKYLAERAKLFDPKKASEIVDRGSPAHQHCDTVYFAVTDKWGNGISFINSTYESFGSGIIPQGCGFTLQNRGANFSLEENHPNVLAPSKRPYHTIIPAMITNAGDGSLHTVYGVMGGFMQPQGHVQVLYNMLKFKMSPQAALDAPRICISADGTSSRASAKDRVVWLEDGIDVSVKDELQKMGHSVEIMSGYGRGLFGRGQVIRCHKDGEKLVYSAGSDLRGDGAAYPV